jgi:hypothetical protein
LNLQAKIRRTTKTRFKLFILKVTCHYTLSFTSFIKDPKRQGKTAFILKIHPWFFLNQKGKKTWFVPIQINIFINGGRTDSFSKSPYKTQQAQLVQFLNFKSQNLVAIKASCQNHLKPIQDVETSLLIASLLRMVTSNLTDGNKPIRSHSPFPQSTSCF